MGAIHGGHNLQGHSIRAVVTTEGPTVQPALHPPSLPKAKSSKADGLYGSQNVEAQEKGTKTIALVTAEPLPSLRTDYILEQF